MLLTPPTSTGLSAVRFTYSVNIATMTCCKQWAKRLSVLNLVRQQRRVQVGTPASSLTWSRLGGAALNITRLQPCTAEEHVRGSRTRA
jgi:hypothetical protein